MKQHSASMTPSVVPNTYNKRFEEKEQEQDVLTGSFLYSPQSPISSFVQNVFQKDAGSFTRTHAGDLSKLDVRQLP